MSSAILDWFDMNPKLRTVQLKMPKEDAQHVESTIAKAVGAGAGRSHKMFVGLGGR